MPGFQDFASARGAAFPILTERLALTPFASADAPEVWAYWQLPETDMWMSRRYAGQAELAETWLTAGNQLVARERSSGMLIGDFMVQIQDAWSQREIARRAKATQAELGWTLAPGFRGRGFAGEAVAGLLDLVFSLGVRRVEASCFADNEPSWRLMERVGMRREARCIKESLHRDLGWVDGLQYALLAEEWHAQAR